MLRIARHAKLKPGCEREYIKRHKEIWPDVLRLIKKAGVKNYSIFISELDLFSYFEVENWDEAIKKMLSDSIGEKFQEYMAPLMDAEDPKSPWTVIDEVFYLE
ncbi:MAG: L-rhamnose mutarotase [Actinobacteria bacterium]|nr:L-rhamnose mutarotase [Actinomycetota bacterium]